MTLPMRTPHAALLVAATLLPGCDTRPSAAAPPPSTASPAPAASTPSAPAIEAPSATAAPPVSSAAQADDAGAVRAPCSEGMALVGRICVDRWEAFLVAPGPAGALTPLPPNERPPAGVRFEARTAGGVMPQAYVSRVEAAAACSNAGKRLCKLSEWRRACEGQASTTFPYGRHEVHGRCNHEKPHLLSARFGADPHRWKYENFNDPSLDVEPGFLARTGAYDGCVSAEGVYDLVGNLHEWVSDTVDADFMEKLEAEGVDRKDQPWHEGNGVFAGGFFSTADQHGPGCTFTTVAHEPAYHDYSIGFRCCAAADLPAPVRGKAKRQR
jgi:formylglycine-generating enzyme